jgi:intracellular multiplication protein IcmS
LSLPQQLASVATTMGCRYLIKGEPVAMEHVFSPTGLLPAIMRRADQLCSFCLGYGLGLTFERMDGATLGVVVQMDDKVPNILRLLCVTDVLHEFMQNAPAPDSISLDELMLD